MKTIRIGASRPYDVVISSGLLDRAGEKLRSCSEAKHAALICGDNVYPLYAERTVRSLERAGFRVSVKVIPHGEEHKTLPTYGEILSFLCENELGRKDPLIALGGGMTGDLTGFAAASYLRGCPFVQIPTTLLSAVDSSVGGKTGINLPGGKNQAGAFYQPLLVLCDPALFSTLPSRELRCGLAEVVKTAVLFDRDLFDSLQEGYDPSCAEDLVARCVEWKRALVEKDEFDCRERRLLNFGHSFGHAVERCSDYRISHGEAVSIGMVMIARASAMRGLCSENTVKEIESLLQKLGLPTECPFSVSILEDAVRHDKKRDADALWLVVPLEIGRCELHGISLAELPEWLRDGGAP